MPDHTNNDFFFYFLISNSPCSQAQAMTLVVSLEWGRAGRLCPGAASPQGLCRPRAGPAQDVALATATRNHWGWPGERQHPKSLRKNPQKAVCRPAKSFQAMRAVSKSTACFCKHSPRTTAIKAKHNIVGSALLMGHICSAVTIPLAKMRRWEKL